MTPKNLALVSLHRMFKKPEKFESAMSTTFWYPICSAGQSTGLKNFIQRFSELTFVKAKNIQLLQNLNISKANDITLLK